MKKPPFLTIISMLILYFLWWFSGGTIIGLRQNPAPFEYFITFFWNNFQSGAATVFEAISSLLNR